MAPDRVAVCDVEDLPPGERLLVAVDDAEVCLFNVDGELFALGATCAHRGGPICKGERTGDTVACPWHGWEYDLSTGEHLGAADARLPSYPVTVEADTVYLETGSTD